MILKKRKKKMFDLPELPYVKEVFCFDSTASTNESAKADIRSGRIRGGALYVADSQTAGKGRTGRSFLSPPGTSIYMSLTVCEKLSPEAFPLLTMVTAAVVANALDKCCDTAALIKWPNDILIADKAGRKKKVAGILTEAVGDTAVIGIGINVNNRSFPDELVNAGSLFTVTGREYDRAQIISGIMNGFDRLLPELVRCQDLSFMREQYEARLISLNKEVVIVPLERTLSSGDTSDYRDSQSEQTGAYICLGIDDHGGLRLMDKNGHETIVNSGEVSLRGLNGYI